VSTAPLPLVVVCGPTGAGKSELAIVLAQAFGGEIVNCDSVQVYRGLDIGTAKIPLADRRGVPHHLIDLLDPNQELTAGAYSRIARNVIAAIHAAGCVPLVTGGTGFYLRALLEGLSPAPPRDDKLRARLSQMGERRPLALHRFLRRYDPPAAARIHPNDRQKLIRAVEMTWLTCQSATTTQSAPRRPLEGAATLKIGLNPDRSLLHGRLNQRAAWMFHHGLLEETRALLRAGVSTQAKPLESLGYKQALKVLTNALSLDEAIGECQARTRQYAKRQMTWFRREPGVVWLNGFGSEPGIQSQALHLARSFLASTATPGARANTLVS